MRRRLALYLCLCVFLVGLVVSSVQPALALPTVLVAGGGNFTLAITPAGGVTEVGFGSSTLSTRLSSGVSAVSAGTNHALALKTDGTVWAWGSNQHGQLGVKTDQDFSTQPVAVPGLKDVVAIAAGNDFSLALTSDGTVWAWGADGSGQLGDGATSDHIAPAAIAGLSGVTAIAAGGSHALALTSDGSVWAWGGNWAGQLGDGTTATRSTPTAVPGLSDVKSIVTGSDFSVALRRDGSVWAWGKGDNGQLASTDGNAYTPQAISGVSGIVAIAAGQAHVLALARDGSVWAWGNNSDGQLGNGVAGSPVAAPAQVTGLSGVVAVSAGGSHSLAASADGSIWAWGFNHGGQLADGTKESHSAPVKSQLRTVATVPATPAAPAPPAPDAPSTYQGLPAVNLSINGQIVHSDVPAVVLGGRTMVPLRVVADAFGAKIGWDGSTATALVTLTPAKELGAQLAKAQQDLATVQAQLTQAQQDLAAAHSEAAKARAALVAANGSTAPTTMTPEQYAGQVMHAGLTGPLAATALGKGRDCSPDCYSWDQTLNTTMGYYGLSYLSYGTTSSVDVLTAPYTLVSVALVTDSKPAFTVDLSDATLTVDGGQPLKPVYWSARQIPLVTYHTATAYMVFPVAPGKQATLTFTAPTRVMSLKAVAPPLPAGYANYALGLAPNPVLVPLQDEIAKNHDGLFMVPTTPLALSLPSTLNPTARMITDDYIRQKWSPASPLIGRGYTYVFFTLHNTSELLAEVKPASFAVRSASTGNLIAPLGFLPVRDGFYDDYNGYFVYPGRTTEVVAVYQGTLQ